jgi:hypothetical protein
MSLFAFHPGINPGATNMPPRRGFQLGLLQAVFKRYVKEHDACITRPATVNVASMGDFTTTVAKVIGSDYRYFLNEELRMQNGYIAY